MTARRHRGRGEGSVYQDKDGKWWASVSLAMDPDTHRRPRRKVGAESRDDARQKLAALQAEMRETGSVGAKNITVAQAIADFMTHPPATWKTHTTATANALHARNLTAGLGAHLLNRLTVAQVEDHLAAEARRGLSRSTVADELFLLRRVIRRAEKRGLVTRNVAELAELPAGLRTRRSRSMTVEQVHKLLDSDLTPWWRAWLSVALLCGTRPGETGALCWDDVKDGVLSTRAGLHETDEGLVRGSLKTPTSRRSIQMPAAVAGALAAWRTEQARQRLAAGALWKDTGLIFTDELGRPVPRQRVGRQFARITEAAGIGHWQPRECRHTFVSVLSGNGVPIEDISDLVGHVNSAITRKVYRHSLTPVIGTAATVMDQIYGGQRESS
jgi:integrase